jgi:hypothetical protein
MLVRNLKVGCLHPVACTRSGSGFPSNWTLVWIFYSVTATCFGLMTIFRRKPWTWASKEVSLEINVEKTKYMLLSRHQNAGQNRDIEIANRSSENVSQFKCLGTTVTNQNLIQEEIKRRLSLGNACYHSVRSLLSSRLLSKNLKMRMPVVLYGCETWSLTLREEHRLRAFENKVLRRMTKEGWSNGRVEKTA